MLCLHSTVLLLEENMLFEEKLALQSSIHIVVIRGSLCKP